MNVIAKINFFEDFNLFLEVLRNKMVIIGFFILSNFTNYLGFDKFSFLLDPS